MFRKLDVKEKGFSLPLDMLIMFRNVPGFFPPMETYSVVWSLTGSLKWYSPDTGLPVIPGCCL